eukprot:COSAG06_NODE_245_length_19176_cov_167.625151_12_plen_53_part_00
MAAMLPRQAQDKQTNEHMIWFCFEFKCLRLIAGGGGGGDVVANAADAAAPDR